MFPVYPDLALAHQKKWTESEGVGLLTPSHAILASMELKLGVKASVDYFSGSSDQIKEVTHLGIVAHADDLEFMCSSPIFECQNSKTKHFLGVVCTDGRSSPRTGKFSKLSDDEMVDLRKNEQLIAAKVGKYFGVIQLGFQSSEIKVPGEKHNELKSNLTSILGAVDSSSIYTHSPFDRHDSHVAICQAVASSLRRMKKRPDNFFGGEVWGSLDWLPEKVKQTLKVNASLERVLGLMEIFKTQIEGGKNYADAALGRKMANATFFKSHNKDDAELAENFIDLSPLLDKKSNLIEFTKGILELFETETKKGLQLWK